MRYPLVLAAILFLLPSFEVGAFAQSNQSSVSLSDTPETAFVSASKYTNAFFGFSLPLPKVPFQGLSVTSSDPANHFLFGLEAELIRSQAFSPQPTVTTLIIEAEAAGADSAKKAQEFVTRGKNALKVQQTEIGGRTFWKGEFEEGGPSGKLRSLSFATAINGYAVEFNITSFDAKLTKQLEQSIEALVFFNPSEAKAVAGADSNPYIGSNLSRLNAGTITGSTYTNTDLGFSYQFPDKWVVMDEATQQIVLEAGHRLVWGDSPSAAQAHELALKCTRILLATSKLPEGTKTEGTNPLIVLMAADPTCSLGFTFPTSVDDHTGIDLVVQKITDGFSGTPFMGQGRNAVHAFAGQGHLMIVVSGSSNITVPTQKAPVTIFVAIAATVTRGYLLMWAFASGSQAELDQMMDSTIAWN